MTQTIPPVHADESYWTRELQGLGKRVTRQRLAVLDDIHDHPHATAEETLGRVRGVLPTITPQSIYTVLADLTAWGIVSKLSTTEGPARYETRVGDNHHHVRCVRCGMVADVPCIIGHAPCLNASDTGMRIVKAEVLFSGICAACDTDSGSAPS